MSVIDTIKSIAVTPLLLTIWRDARPRTSFNYRVWELEILLSGVLNNQLTKHEKEITQEIQDT